VIDVVPEYVDVVSCPDDTVLRSIRDVVPAMRSAVAKQCLLYESGVAPWAHRATTMPINGYTHFAGPAKSRASAKLEARTFTAAPPSGAVSHSV
jgi:hypothetical protein